MALEPVGKALEPSGKASEPAVRASEPAGRLQSWLRASELAGRPAEGSGGRTNG